MTRIDVSSHVKVLSLEDERFVEPPWADGCDEWRKRALEAEYESFILDVRNENELLKHVLG